MDSSCWRYAGEGGKHAVFEYLGTGEWEGRAIRFIKNDICGDPAKSKLRPNSSGFVKAIVVPLLSPFIDSPCDIFLTRSFVEELRQQALERGEIPQSRQKSWNTSNHQCRNDPVPATSLWNYKRIPEDSYTTFLTLEIKPKAGYLAVSPLVCPVNRAKYKYSRFTILQELTAQGRITKGWQAEGDFVKSAYNPIDLYSGDFDKVSEGLRSLFAQPQNNLKVWFGDLELIGMSGQHRDYRNLATEAAQVIFRSEVEDLDGVLIELLTEILVQENLLSKLLQLQKLDVVDADGALLIYQRLIDVCDGDLDFVNRLLSEMPVLSNNWRRTPSSPSLGPVESPFEVPNCPTLKPLADHINKFASALAGDHMDKQGMDQSYERAVAYISCLSSDVCVFLIQNWLFSLAMSDVSFFVTIRPSEALTLPKMCGVGNGRYQIIRQQSFTGPGLAVKSCTIHGECEVTGWVYSIKLVDCDNKPVSKLHGRSKKEALIKYFQS